jgi:iron complex outermembrane receptor protein
MANCGPNALFTNNKYLTNRLLTSISDNFQTADETTTLTDYWVHNASFLKCDNITLGYSFQNLFKCAGYHGLAGRIYGTVNNVFTITNYKGLDPEINYKGLDPENQGGIDRDVYPRPISFILGLSLNF